MSFLRINVNSYCSQLLTTSGPSDSKQRPAKRMRINEPTESTDLENLFAGLENEALAE